MRRVSRPILHAVILGIAVFTALYAMLLPSRAITGATVIFDSAVGMKFAGTPVSGNEELAFAFIGATHLELPVNPTHARIPAFENQEDPLKEASTPPLGQREANLLSSEFGGASPGVEGRLQRAGCDSGVGKLYCVYTVQEGDALASIASQFGMLGTSDGFRQISERAPWAGKLT